MRDDQHTPQLVLGRNGRLTAVLLDVDDYHSLLDELERLRVEARVGCYHPGEHDEEVPMVATSLPKEIAEVVEGLDPAAQQQVLDLARALKARRPRGTPARELLKFAGTIPKEDADEMMRIIDEGCGRIDPNGW